MNRLKYALMFFFVVDALMFVVYQTAPELLAVPLPQFDIESPGHSYQRLVGNLFLALGLARLYGGLFIQQKGAFVLSMWSWAIELIYTVTELAHGQFLLVENLMALVLAPLMLGWSFVHYRKTFMAAESGAN